MFTSFNEMIMTDIVEMTENECLESGMELVYEKEYTVPGSLSSSLSCYALNEEWMKQDNGIISYNVRGKDADQKLDLKFCITGNRYCNDEDCKQCPARSMGICNESIDMVSLFNFSFSPNYLQQFVGNNTVKNKREKVLAFQYKSSFSKLFPVCPRQRSVLNSLLEGNYSGVMGNIFFNSKAHEILLYSMECLVDDKGGDMTFSCRFLSDDSGLQKIQQAKEILLENLGTPLTIKELSRRVAINECYLKKGFKEVFGTTIFDFYQQQRMDHAKYLLYQKGMNVTDVAAILGYSSISHFSTAFKKQTGIKPCELLLR